MIVIIYSIYVSCDLINRQQNRWGGWVHTCQCGSRYNGTETGDRRPINLDAIRGNKREKDIDGHDGGSGTTGMGLHNSALTGRTGDIHSVLDKPHNKIINVIWIIHSIDTELDVINPCLRYIYGIGGGIQTHPTCAICLVNDQQGPCIC